MSINKEKAVLVKVDIRDFEEYMRTVDSFNADINLYYTDTKCFDAKSTISSSVFIIGKPRYLEIVSDNYNEINEFKTIMKRFAPSLDDAERI